MTAPNPEDEEDDENPDATIARLLKKMIRRANRAHLPRYKGRSRVSGKIAAYCRPSDPAMVELRLSYDIVKQLHAWIMHYKTVDDLSQYSMDRLKLHVIRFKRKSVPIVLIRLEDVVHVSTGHKLTRRAKTWQFKATFKATDMGIRTEMGTIPALELIPWPALAAYCAIIPPSHRIWGGKHVDPYAWLEGLIDPNEPPRYKGRRDPEYQPEVTS